MPVGVLVAGACGYTGSTFIAGVLAMSQGLMPAGIMGSVTTADRWRSAGLADPSEMIFGGWDICSGGLSHAVQQAGVLPRDVISALTPALLDITIYQGCRLSSDFAINSTVPIRSAMEAVAKYRMDIAEFKSKMAVERVCVVILLPPERDIDRDILTLTSTELRDVVTQDDGARVRSAYCFALAALQERCAVIDFTPSSALEAKGIVDLARNSGMPLAGRDGSTGQTILKVWLAELFRERGLRLRGWYSTNIIGNSDGLALSEHDRRAVKIVDKSRGLESIYPEPGLDHLVRIDYFPSRGDNKESWDAIELRGWFDLDIQLRLNWQGRDSVLAAPLLYDLTRLVFHDRTWNRGGGVVKELGYFFKHPLGTDERRARQLMLMLEGFFEID